MNLKPIHDNVTAAIDGLVKLSSEKEWTPTLGTALTQLRAARTTLAGHSGGGSVAAGTGQPSHEPAAPAPPRPKS